MSEDLNAMERDFKNGLEEYLGGYNKIILKAYWNSEDTGNADEILSHITAYYLEFHPTVNNNAYLRNIRVGLVENKLVEEIKRDKNIHTVSVEQADYM